MKHSSKQKTAYFHALQKGIIDWCDRHELNDANVFLYGEINLRYSVQKKLYFKHIEDANMLDDFLQNDRINAALFSSPAKFRGLRHSLRKVKSSSTSASSPTHPSEVIALIGSEKHRLYLQQTIPGTTVSIFHSDDLQDIRENAIPQKALASELLFKEHYDLLVECEVISTWLKQQKPKKVLCVEGNSPQDNIVAQVANHMKVHSVVLQFGWAFTVHTGFQNMGCAEYLSWGKAFSDELQAFNPSTLFTNIGHPGLEQPRMARKQTDVSVILQAPVRLIGEDTFAAFLEAIHRMAEAGLTIEVREHPSWPLDPKLAKPLYAKSNVSRTAAATTPLNDQLERSTFALTIFSSVGFECMLASCIPVFYQEGMEIQMVPSIDKSEFAFLFHERDQIIDELKALLSDQARIANLQSMMNQEAKNYYSAVGQVARRNLAAALHRANA